MTRLPPLNALRAFEVAARHLALTRAADELNVTHGAVSRQILTLEKSLGTVLFVRGPRGLTLTAEGATLAQTVTAAFQMLQVGVAQVSDSATNEALRLSVPPTLAMRWLIPRLGALHRSHPTLRLDLSTSTAPVDFATNPYDAAIRRVDVTPKGWTTVPFLDGRSVPVCSSAYRKRQGLKSEAQLATATLVVTRSERHAWRDWLRRRQVRRDDGAPSLVFDELYFALQAALDSLGVALVPLAVIADELKSGRLVALAEPSPDESRHYALLSPRRSGKRNAIAELGDWLQVIQSRAPPTA